MHPTKEKITVLTIVCDEELAKTGFLTRLEAFAELLKWHRKKLSNDNGK